MKRFIIFALLLSRVMFGSEIKLGKVVAIHSSNYARSSCLSYIDKDGIIEQIDLASTIVVMPDYSFRRELYSLAGWNVYLVKDQKSIIGHDREYVIRLD